MGFDSERQERVNARFWTLRSLGLEAYDANEISKILEYRCMCHERIGATLIYTDMWLEAERWADLYRRVVEYLPGKHADRMYDVLARLELSVCA